MSHLEIFVGDPHMSDDKKAGITHAIRIKLGFEDSRLWKRFLARRLELIDALDLSSKKASDQEDEIKRVAEILRLEFHYDIQFIPDFDKLVRAAVQSVRRNRKRGTKTGRGPVKRRALEPDHQTEHSSVSIPEKETTPPEKNQFLSEISNLNTDGFDSLYDMSYSTTRVISKMDRSRAAIDSIIKPANIERKLSKSGIQLPPILNVTPSPRHAEHERILLTLKLSLLWLMKRSKLCLSLASLHKNESVRLIGQSSIVSVQELMLESSFGGLTQTSVEYLRERISLTEFQARFYLSLEPECPVSSTLDSETAVSTLQTLVGCCVKDFGFDSVLYIIGEAFYLLLLQEYPLVLRSSIPFRRDRDLPRPLTPIHKEFPLEQPASLTNLAAVATELRSQHSTESPITMASDLLQKPSSNEFKFEQPVPVPAPAPETRSALKKQVTLRFLSSSLDFMFSMDNSAPPRFTEIVDNAKQAFKLQEGRVYGLKNTKTGLVVNTDLDLEHIFAHEREIELEVFTQKFSPISFSEITTAIMPNPGSDDRTKIILPLPVRQNISQTLSVSPSERGQLPVHPRVPQLPKFQPLL